MTSYLVAAVVIGLIGLVFIVAATGLDALDRPWR